MGPVRRVLKHKGTMAATVVVVVALTVAGTYYWKEWYPSYRACGC